MPGAITSSRKLHKRQNCEPLPPKYYPTKHETYVLAMLEDTRYCLQDVGAHLSWKGAVEPLQRMKNPAVIPHTCAHLENCGSKRCCAPLAQDTSAGNVASMGNGVKRSGIRTNEKNTLPDWHIELQLSWSKPGHV